MIGTYTGAVDTVVNAMQLLACHCEQINNGIFIGNVDMNSEAFELGVCGDGDALFHGYLCRVYRQVCDHDGRGAFFGKM
jgi:hypothetical protein